MLSKQQIESGMVNQGWFNWLRPGFIKIMAKWQAGHWDHAQIHSVRFAVFGVDTGWIVLSLRHYIPVITIQLKEAGEIYVNAIRGNIYGNQKYLE